MVLPSLRAYMLKRILIPLAITGRGANYELYVHLIIDDVLLVQRPSSTQSRSGGTSNNVHLR